MNDNRQYDRRELYSVNVSTTTGFVNVSQPAFTANFQNTRGGGTEVQYSVTELTQPTFMFNAQ